MKPKGGHGKKAPYTTSMVRCPDPIKPEIQAIINFWHDGHTISAGDFISRQSSGSESVQVALDLIGQFIAERNLTEKLHTRDNTNLRRFRDWLQLKLENRGD